MNYKRFEELPCWNQARELSQAVFKIINMVIQEAQVKCSNKNYKKDWIPACAGMTCFVNHLYLCLSSLRKQGSKN